MQSLLEIEFRLIAKQVNWLIIYFRNMNILISAIMY